MVRTGLFFRVLMAFVLIGLLAAGGVGLYRAGWVQGYQTSALAASAAANGGAPQAPVYGPMPYRFYPGFAFPGFFPPVGLFFGLGLLVLFLFAIGGRSRAWHNGPDGWRHGHPGFGGEPSGYWAERAKEWHARQHAQPEAPAGPGNPPVQE